MTTTWTDAELSAIGETDEVIDVYHRHERVRVG